MATEKYLYDCATRWASKPFLTKSCAKIIASGASCSAFYFKCTSALCHIRKSQSQFRNIVKLMKVKAHPSKTAK